jgi:hypothetical protein
LIWKCLCSSSSVVFSLGLLVSSTNKTDRHDIADRKPKSSRDCMANPKPSDILWVWQHLYIYSNVKTLTPQPPRALDWLQDGCMGFVPTGLTVDNFINTRDWYNDHFWENQALKILRIYGNFMSNVSECLAYYLKVSIWVRFQ